MIAPRHMMLITAVNDFQYEGREEEILTKGFKSIALNVRKVYRLLGADEKYFLNILYTHGHTFPETYREQAYEFIQNALRDKDKAV